MLSFGSLVGTGSDNTLDFRLPPYGANFAEVVVNTCTGNPKSPCGLRETPVNP